MHIHKTTYSMCCVVFNLYNLLTLRNCILFALGWSMWMSRSHFWCMPFAMSRSNGASACHLTGTHFHLLLHIHIRCYGVSVFGTRKPNLINLSPFASESIQTTWFSVLSLFPLHALRLNFASAMRDFSQSIFAIEKTSNINLFLCLSHSCSHSRWMCENEVLCLLSNCLHNNSNGCAAQVVLSVHQRNDMKNYTNLNERNLLQTRESKLYTYRWLLSSLKYVLLFLSLSFSLLLCRTAQRSDSFHLSRAWFICLHRERVVIGFDKFSFDKLTLSAKVYSILVCSFPPSESATLLKICWMCNFNDWYYWR